MIEPNDPRLAAYIARALATLARRDPVTPAERAYHAALIGKPAERAYHAALIGKPSTNPQRVIVGPEPRL